MPSAISRGLNAPSAKRCIKTRNSSMSRCPIHPVRKHRAPKGALRLTLPFTGFHPVRVRKQRAPKDALRQQHPLVLRPAQFRVRKHRAPKGALRLVREHRVSIKVHASQKAPSAKRCIKTIPPLRRRCIPPTQKAPSTKRCIKTASIPYPLGCA